MSKGGSSKIKSACKIASNNLVRPALPSSRTIFDFFTKKRSQTIWIEGYSIGDNVWRNYGFRELDENNAAIMMSDYSLEKNWYIGEKSNDYQTFAPTVFPIYLKMKKDFCNEKSKMKFLVMGRFIERTSKDSISPQIVFKINDTTEVFHIDFRIGDSTKYFTWSRSNQNNSEFSKFLPKFDIDKNFNLSITCNEHSLTGGWKIVMNYWDPGDDPNGLARDSFEWDLDSFSDRSLNPKDINTIMILGQHEWNIDFAGFTFDGCLSLSPNGLVMPLSGHQCEEEKDYLCEYQSCYTKDGFECIFPFTYKEQLYKNCISEDVYQPWCPTKIGDGDHILDWGLCLDDCDYIPPQPSCLNPPPVPMFGFRDSSNNTVYENYASSWFNLSFVHGNLSLSNLTYLVTRDSRKKLYQPLMIYDSNELYDQNLSFEATNHSDFFHDVYEIIPEGGTADYTCPLGWVFEDSKNTTQTAICRNWTWNVQFNVSKPCVPVVCPEEELPLFPNNSAIGTTNMEEVKSLNGSEWNSWRGRVTYTCPQGYVLEVPGNFDEQQDPIPDEVDIRSFIVECGDNAVWTPRLSYDSTDMPRCIPINCTEIPFPVANNDLGMYNWTGIQGRDPRPYATKVKYFCPRRGWGFPSSGKDEMYITCEMDGYWSNLQVIEECMKLPCPGQPPSLPNGPGAEFVYDPYITHYRCQNGYMFEDGHFPYLKVECLNRKWNPRKLPACIPRKCNADMPIPYKGLL